MNNKLKAAAILSSVVLAFLGGRFSVPATVVEKDRIVTIDREVSAHSFAYVGSSDAQKSLRTVWRTREVRRLDGTVEINTDGRQELDTREVSKVATETKDTQISLSTREEIHERTVDKKAPDWLLAARAGVTAERSTVFQVGVARRILGPVFVEGWFQKADAYAAGVGASLLF